MNKVKVTLREKGIQLFLAMVTPLYCLLVLAWWKTLRWEMTTSQLVELAARLSIDISDIPSNTQRKHKIAKRLWEWLEGK